MLSKKTLIDLDPWLAPHSDTIDARRTYIERQQKKLLGGKTVKDFALGHLYFGLHKVGQKWVFREWAPNAKKIVLLGDFNNWVESPEFELTRKLQGVFEITLPASALQHLHKYQLHLYWEHGDGYRIPSYATRVIQNPDTLTFDAQVWDPPSSYVWKYPSPPAAAIPLIYEAHIGMSSEAPKVASYESFTKNVLPHIKKSGYNTVQLMAVQEHPYYGSFGYHVSSFFAASSRFGTPDELKTLIDTAHGMGLTIILDIVHSHAVKNETEGLSRFDGTTTQYFHAGDRGVHNSWDSRCFDYGKHEVSHFLLSNCRYWLDEYRFDGFRFDGVTSMIYTHHGINKAFTSYDDYFSDDVDLDALVYLSLANELVHTVNPQAITLAEEMSALPGLTASQSFGGIGFDYRMSMGVPDLWIKTLKETRDEDWDLSKLFHELTTHRPEEKVISYTESHDQALVGDKTLIFRLIDKEMYNHMQIADTNLTVERGIALHKMIRLLTAATHGGGYLNFMGNEFGHPEWIDFPREGNNWSYHYARRQWSLASNIALKYQWLGLFDTAMLQIVQTLGTTDFQPVTIRSQDGIIAFTRSDYLFVFNFSPSISRTDYAIVAPNGQYYVALTTDEPTFGGQGRVDTSLLYKTTITNNSSVLTLYLPARTAVVLKRSTS
ncbi:1,4-alpha-glucan-branching enzyme [Candidatus Saccharibacteria bacterium]|nr:1,4-alpha-glucan-branching enzyme [Candidatus Saccharibacteria bacterium]